MRMRIFVVLLGLMALAKFGVHEHLYRTATRDALVAAYRERAALACQKDARGQSLALGAQFWTRPAEFKVVIGKSDLDVRVWQIDHAQWNARFRNPYLWLMSSERPGELYCEFDVLHGTALVGRT